MRKPHRTGRLNRHLVTQWEIAAERRVLDRIQRTAANIDRWDTDEAVMGYDRIYGSRKTYIHGGCC